MNMKVDLKFVSLLAAIVINSGTMFFWAGGINTRVSGSEERIARLEISQTEMSRQQSELKSTVSAINARTQMMAGMLQNLDRKMDRGVK